MTISSEEKQWAETDYKQLFEIAKGWAKKYTTKQLRVFQKCYSTPYPQGTNETLVKALENRWQAATWAIDIREFGD